MSPTSGDGASIRGARFNPKGIAALYLSTSLEGAIVEASQGFGHRMHPLTLCSYDVDCQDVLDLTDAATREAHGISEDEMAAAWATALSLGKRPRSWNVYDALAKTKAGILVPSYAHRAKPTITNLVLWKWSDKPPHQVQVIDPDARLPKNRKSWE